MKWNKALLLSFVCTALCALLFLGSVYAMLYVATVAELDCFVVSLFDGYDENWIEGKTLLEVKERYGEFDQYNGDYPPGVVFYNVGLDGESDSFSFGYVLVLYENADGIVKKAAVEFR